MSLGELENRIWPRQPGSPHPWSLSLLAKTPKGSTLVHTLTLPFRTAPLFHGKLPLLAEELEHREREGATTILAVSSKEKARRLKEILREQGISSRVFPGAEETTGSDTAIVRIQVADLESGFDWVPGRLLVLTEAEIYGRQKKNVILPVSNRKDRRSVLSPILRLGIM